MRKQASPRNRRQFTTKERPCTLLNNGTLILLGGVAVFAVAALLVLYSYYEGQLDQNHNGIPDFLDLKLRVWKEAGWAA